MYQCLFYLLVDFAMLISKKVDIYWHINTINTFSCVRRFSGLGDAIVAVMRHEQVLYPNVKVVSNFLKYEHGTVNGFSNEYPLIHTFNKNETVLEGTEYYEMVRNRKHVILMGYVSLKCLFLFFSYCSLKSR